MSSSHCRWFAGKSDGLTQSPCSKHTTLNPLRASVWATTPPDGPAPMMTTSAASVDISFLLERLGKSAADPNHRDVLQLPTWLSPWPVDAITVRVVSQHRRSPLRRPRPRRSGPPERFPPP